MSKESEFWKDWETKTKLEEAAINSINIAEELLFGEFPEKQIVSIYVRGSFVRREMNEESDVDIFVIIKESEYLVNFVKLRKICHKKYSPKINFLGYSLWELEHNKLTSFGKVLRASPSRFVRHLDNYKLIYGKQLRKEDFALRTPEKHLKGMIYAFKNIFIPGYNENKVGLGFSEIVKQVFWLVEQEQIMIGKNPPHHWGELAKSIKDKNHIIHNALKLRLKPTTDDIERKVFLEKLNKYLEELSKKYL